MNQEEVNSLLEQRDYHWKCVLEQELLKLKGNIRDRVNGELVECFLSLDREEPNVQLCLRRLKHIQEIVSK
jgi:hypothetical protein